MPVRANLASVLGDWERHGKQLAIQAPSGLRQRKTTYHQLATLSRRFAAELTKRDICKGDRVLIWGESGAEWVGAFFGCVLRGVLAVPVDFASTHDFVRRVRQEVSPKLIVADQEKLQALGTGNAFLGLEKLAEVITTSTIGAVSDLTESDPLQIIFTSGTTGAPKGVVHTHKNVLASLLPIEEEMQKYLKCERLVHPIRILNTLPLSHVFGQFMGLWIPPLMAAEIHFEARLLAPDMIERIHLERISVLAAVPRVLDLTQNYLLDRFPDLESRLAAAGHMKAWKRWWQFRDIHRLFGFKFWALVCGGASLSAASERFWNSLGFVVIQGYGMTETTALVSLNHPFRAAEGSVGQVLPGREVKLSQEGEVLVRGDMVSNATWHGGQVQRERSDWLATGDLADLDESGNLRFRGRKKDVIVTSAGMNIHPEDLEAALSRQPGIKASAVVEASGKHGPEPLAALVMNADAEPAEAISKANAELADFQQIRQWILWPEPDLPRTSTGKVLRREVARQIGESGVAGTSLSQLNGDLNLDSLGRVQLQSRLEQQYGVSLDDNALQQVKTGEDVRKLIQQTPAAPHADVKGSINHKYPRWPWNPVMQAFRSAFLEGVAMLLVRLLAKPGVNSAVKDWPSSPMLIVANHVTSYDVPLVLYALPGRIRRRVAVAMSGEMILDWRRARNQGNWFLNAVAPIEYLLVTAFFNIFPLPQYSGFRRSFRHAGEAMDSGYNVLVFPEGRRSDDGTPQPFKSGAGLLWKELAAPALPVYLAGLGEIKAQHARWFRSGKISVSVGDVLPHDSAKRPEQLTEILREAVFRQASVPNPEQL